MAYTLREQQTTGSIARSVRRLLTSLKKEILMAEKELKNLIKQDALLSQKCNLLMSIPGVGETTAVAMVSYLRELGQLNKRQIAALTGLAPVNNDSGLFKGKRRIKGGRSDIRALLFMPILGAATQHNPRLIEIYNKLVTKGKPKKVALTACMRKLVVWANTMVANNEPWAYDKI